jgi:hypothetical protein
MYAGMRAVPPGTDTVDFRYLTEEYFVSGTANGQPYKTRVVVRRPSNPETFSGFVQAEPTHFSGNALIFQAARVGIMQRRDVAIDIAARNTNNITLFKAFNPARYASLNIPDPGQTNEILAQVGELVKSNSFRGGLTGYAVRHIILSGTSDSSNVVRAYLGVHSGFTMPDSSPIYDGYFLTATLGNTPLPVVSDVPMVQMPTQTEVNSNAAAGDAYRRPDSDAPNNRFRLYEVAGMSHADSRDSPPVSSCDLPLSSLPYGAFTFMGLQHLFDWISPGTPPPHMASYIAVDNDLANDGSRLDLDQFGNAKGGVRNTYVDVPVAKYGIPNSGPGQCSLLGYQTPLPATTVAELYKNRGLYVSRVNARLEDLIREGWFPPEYADVVRSDAQGSST